MVWHFVRHPLYIYVWIFLELGTFRQNLYRKSRHAHIIFITILPKILPFMREYGGNLWRLRTTDANITRRMLIACRISKGYRCTLRMCNTYCRCGYANASQRCFISTLPVLSALFPAAYNQCTWADWIPLKPSFYWYFRNGHWTCWLNGYGDNGERKFGLLVVPRTVPVSRVVTCMYTAHVRPLVSQPSQAHSAFIINRCHSYSEL